MVRLVKESSTETITNSLDSISLSSFQLGSLPKLVISRQNSDSDVTPTTSPSLSRTSSIRSNRDYVFDLLQKNELNISLTKGTSGLLTTTDTKYKISDSKGQDVLFVKEVQQTFGSTVKILSVEDKNGKEIVRISYRLGLNNVRLFKSNGDLIGECTSSEVTTKCIPTFSKSKMNKYNLIGSNNQQVMKFKGCLSFYEKLGKTTKPNMNIKSNIVSDSKIGTINLSNEQREQYTCNLKFESTEIVNYEQRRLVLGTCIGLLDYSYEKNLNSKYSF